MELNDFDIAMLKSWADFAKDTDTDHLLKNLKYISERYARLEGQASNDLPFWSRVYNTLEEELIKRANSTKDN